MMTVPVRTVRSADAAQPVRRGNVVAFPAADGFGRARPRGRFSLVVDLASEELGWRWCHGAATLAGLCGCALAFAPGLSLPDTGARPAGAMPGQTLQYAPLAAAATGTAPAMAPAADALPKPRGIAAGERDGLKRISGDVTEGLYWSLRGAGASTEIAAAYLQALATRIDVGEVASLDRFDFVVDTARSSALVYAALDRNWAPDVAIVSWPAGRTSWHDTGAGANERTTAGLMSPVAGRITSRFGSRRHPILGFARFHSGIDFGASWGTPIVAAADGQVVGAGWAGGYGRQLVVAHGGGIATTYSHMSGFVAGAGTPVRQGQVIGYVGSSGLSTGPHLHFEVRVGGRAVNPLSVQLTSRPAMSDEQLRAFKARVRELTSIPLTKA